MVLGVRLELTCLTALASKASVSTISPTEDKKKWSEILFLHLRGRTFELQALSTLGAFRFPLYVTPTRL